MDGEAPRGVGRQYSEGRNLRRGGGSPARLDHGEIEDWREKFLLGAENALRSRPKDEGTVWDEQIKMLKRKIRDLVLSIDILREALKP